MKSRSEAAIPVLSSSLRQQPSGIWMVEQAGAELSYPKSGNESCFQLEDNSFWFNHRNRCISAVAARYDVQGPFLDIGGGNGFVSLALQRAGLEPILLEPGSQGAQNGRTRGLPSVICATLDQARFHDGAFPSAGAFDVIEHIEDETGFLRSARRILKAGGHFLVTVPAYSWLWSEEDDYAGHYRRYTLGSLRRALEQAGFSWVYGTYIFGALVLPILMLRSLPYRLGRKGTPGQNPEKDHGQTNGVLRSVLAPELLAIKAGLPFPMGSSCLALVRKS